MVGSVIDPQLLQRPDGILPDHEVQVWYVDLAVWDSSANQLLGVLNTEEQERAARFKFPAPRNQFVISRALLRRALGLYLRVDEPQVQFRTSTKGKPELADDRGLRFNLSHTEGATVFAIARKRNVGIDVERIRDNPDVMELAARFFSGEEVQWLRSQPTTEISASFFRVWTGKEAYIKAQGDGLSKLLSSFSVLPSDEGSRLRLNVYDDPEESKRWRMYKLDLGLDLQAALAVEGDGARVRLGNWPGPGAG
jgi:4'-phosphopantetheinyl transferase